ncbi:MAG: cob(I)yrinic acid a,c-diamide adenosyltransferase [Candidatus Harrisonbacteria bacterium CG10_big_fil_rev_8_21_14_0_10_44_23]|uniref:Cob(I)yrinic acid a,c-diamide adenosyltransferase n=1 Tax=Candidatus Harrisonbacteria bacterium CG10_big_fil_rev_8_21_14_0_10_44_23 TaxID=1974585 RepID=A0A2H0UPY9_9BACT|nr:MAG: cob(I)yrinic acid a,c-diamide adenosyltransferase [Candidatus Harrisonbacteria bacterium CG10_big_fil_rev_8_21_14_0_10_44_23]
MLVINTGDGKGKTTAALGAALRAVGRGKNVLMIQFIKGPWESGEDISVGELLNREAVAKSNIKTGEFVLKKMGKGFVGILGDSLPIEEHKRAAQQALEFARGELEGKKWDLVILDEINVALSLKLLDLKQVLEAVDNFLEDCQDCLLLLTGRGVAKELIDRADLVTEMKEIKHPYNQGKDAKISLEF